MKIKLTSMNVLHRNWCSPDGSRSLTRWQQFSAWNDVMAILKVWRHNGNLTLSVYADSIEKLEEHSCQILSWFDLKLWSIRLFWRGHPNNNNNNKMSRYSVPDLKMFTIPILRTNSLSIVTAISLNLYISLKVIIMTKSTINHWCSESTN